MKRKITVSVAVLGILLALGLGFSVSANKSEMAPNMPGMDHSTPNENHAEGDRPLAATLGVFGLASSIVFSSAFFLKRKDIKIKELKQRGRNERATTL